MGKLGGLALITVVGLTACTAPSTVTAAPQEAEVQQVAHISTQQQKSMLDELRPHLTTLEASDSALYREAYEACANLLVRDKDAYREAVLDKYDNVELAVDHLTVAAAAKKYICP